MIAATLTDIDRHADAIRRDAEALLTVAAWADLPAGIAILPMTRTDAGGVCIGSGHLLAIAHELRPGAVAVQVDIEALVRKALGAVPQVAATVADAAREVVETIAADAARRAVEGIAIHEAAHAIVAPADTAASAAEAKAVVTACNATPFADAAASHDPRWAAAVVILSRRSWRLRPADEREEREAIMRRDIGNYGLDADAIAEALGDIDAEASVRELLAPGGAVAARVAAACPPEAERRAFIEHRRQHGAAGEVGIVSSKESAGARW